MSEQLPDFEGRAVTAARLRIIGAGDGLSEALSIQPKPWHMDDEVSLVVRVKVSQVNHRPEKEGDEDLVRFHTAKVVGITEVAAEDVESYLADAKERIRVAKDAAAGQEQLPMEQPKAKRKPVADPGPGVTAGVRVVDDADLDAEGAMADGSRFDASDLPLVGAGVTTPDGEE
jgi:hypothetical protein